MRERERDKKKAGGGGGEGGKKVYICMYIYIYINTTGSVTDNNELFFKFIITIVSTRHDLFSISLKY